MSGGPVAVRSTGPAEPQTSSAHLVVLVYALSGGVLWWAFHLVALAALTPAVCDGVPRWWFTVVNAVAVAGAATAVWCSLLVRRDRSTAGRTTGRVRFLAHVALLFNVASLTLVVLESVPVYFLGAC